MEIKKATFWAYHVYYFKKDRNATETHTQKKISAVYGEGSVTDRTCQKWFVKFHAEISCLMMFHSWVDPLKLIGITLID